MRSLLLLTAILISSPLFGEAPVYRVVGKNGPIFIKPPLGTEWLPLRSKILPMGTILRVEAGAKIDIALQDNKKDDEAVRRKIRIAQPLITRLDEDLVRRMQIRSYPLKGLWDEGAEASKETTESPILSFASSFFRSVVSLQRNVELPPVGGKDPQTEPVDVGSKLQTIEILSPVPESLVFLNGSTARVPLIWQAPKDGLEYKVYMWPEGELRSKPLAVLRETWLEVPFTKMGRYTVQVEDSSRRYRSEPLAITVDRRLGQKLGQGASSEEAPLELIYPQTRSTLLKTRIPATLKFAWDASTVLQPKERYRLIVQTTGKERIQKETLNESFGLSLPPGQYRWWVERVGKRPLRSETRELTVETSSPANLAKSLQLGQGRTVVLDLDGTQ